VYLAHDDELNRPVAIKVPHRGRVFCPEDLEAYIAEARIVASLDHPNIVPVYHVGQTEDGLCYVVSKFIEGGDLRATIERSRPSPTASVELVATLAESLHYAHLRGLVHRDIKPANILLDRTNRPYIADFGLALKDEDFGKQACSAGTPAYMSPEQARGEGHRVDGRADVFGLGVVLYELLTGYRPFPGKIPAELLEQITTIEPRPLRQRDNSIPRELERICLKALSKRVMDRYLTAADMADDLRNFLRQASEAGRTIEDETARLPMSGSSVSLSAAFASAFSSHVAVGSAATASSLAPSSDKVIKVVPKGLRSFDAHDADFFLELLPGPRDRDGLPDSIRFWKTRIEETDPDNTFSVGLIYGPSGCGKSSLVKAGLLPRLGEHVVRVYVEATANETEARLLRGLRKQFPELPVELGLQEALAALRRGRIIPPGGKALIVLDQFEQWLHGKRQEQSTGLVQALRQCDGERVQCLLMVRDDFPTAINRFMRELEVRQIEGHNVAAVDLFDLRHALKLLAAFGRAFGALPEDVGQLTKEQRGFLEQATTTLAEEGKVVCVRLALFAEMMKGKPWTPATLKAVGGTEGVGVTFLEETFSASTAPPEHRCQQKAARGVLKALLPESGTDIKGLMRSHQELLEVSGYANRPRDFDDLVRILDSELRLITPTDPEGRMGDDVLESSVPTGQKYYQLTHDYLVPSLRHWLTRKQKETKRGRAQLLLADRASVWNTRPENRQFPSLFQWASIRLLTKNKNWSDPQRKMMKRAGRYHAFRGCVLAIVLTVAGWGSHEGYGRLRATALVQTLATAETADVPKIIEELSGYYRWAVPALRSIVESSDNPKAQLHASLALLPVDTSRVEYLYERLLKADPGQVQVIVSGLQGHKADLIDGLWNVLEDANRDADERLRVACALAAYTPDDPRWTKVGRDVVARLVTEDSLVLGKWIEGLRPVSGFLEGPLADIIEDDKSGEPKKIASCEIVAVYAADNPARFQELEKGLAKPMPLNAGDEQKTALAKHKADIAAAFLRMSQYERMREVLRHTSDPTARSYLISRLSSLAIEPKMIWSRLRQEKDVSIRRALILGMGEFEPERLARGEREGIISQLVQLYRDDPDPGIHGATEWLLRHWKQDGRVKTVTKELATGKLEGQRQWYVTRQGHTMVVISGPRVYLGGSDLAGAAPGKARIPGSLAISDKDVTVELYLRFRKDHQAEFNELDCPVDSVTWYDAAAYCNWLSEQEGLPEDQFSYEPNAKKSFDKGMKIRLNRQGYRLPSEWEWEYACRAGSVTNYCFGQPEELLGRYGWSSMNSTSRTWPVATLRPNDLGLFDVHGNVFQWCQYAMDQGEGKEKDGETVEESVARALRGGAFGFRPWYLRSDNRNGNQPGSRSYFIGFRPARTYSRAPLPLYPSYPPEPGSL
jgi:serine/threonine protein kinase/formylglycine-generating enzyme required for sulfatase activity